MLSSFYVILLLNKVGNAKNYLGLTRMQIFCEEVDGLKSFGTFFSNKKD